MLRHPACEHTEESTLEIIGMIREEFSAIDELRAASEEEIDSWEAGYMAAMGEAR